MEKGNEEAQNQQQLPIDVVTKEKKTTTYIPIDIVKEILNRLPLKTLARFNCASKHWFFLISLITQRRLGEEFHRRIIKSHEHRRGLVVESEKLVHFDVEEIQRYRDRMKAKLGEMLSVWVFEDDISRCIKGFPRFRDAVSEFRGHFAADIDEYLRTVDTLIGNALQDEAEDA